MSERSLNIIIIHRSIPQHTGAQKVSSASPSPMLVQRTVSFPWMHLQMARSTTACQPPQSTQAFWSPMYAPQPSQGPPTQATPMPYYPWSLPTSPYLQNSMQAWSVQLPMPSSAASDLSQTVSKQPQYTYARRQSDSVERGTPAHTSSSSASAPPQDAKKSKFFALPSIFCTLRRWHAKRKEKRNKKVVEVPVIDDPRNMSMRSSASLPGAYSRSGFQRGPSSDQGITGTFQYCQNYLTMTSSIQQQQQQHHPMYPSHPQMCAGDPSSFINQMHQSLSTYRTQVDFLKYWERFAYDNK